MPPFDDALTSTLVQNSQEQAADLAASLSSAAETALQLAAGTPVPMAAGPPPIEPDVPGWLLSLAWDGPAILIALPQAAGVLSTPPEDQEPLANWTRRWQSAAQELGFGLFPDAPPDRADVEVAASLLQSLENYQIEAAAMMMPWTLTAGDQSVTAHVIWPATRRSPATADAAPTAASSPNIATPQAGAEHSSGAAVADEDEFAHLSPYTRSLLKIRVPVMVTLATKKERVADIVRIAPGSLLQFDKTCESLLTLEVRNKPVAIGEAVKVEDRFGLRVTSIMLPPEKYLAVKSADQN